MFKSPTGDQTRIGIERFTSSYEFWPKPRKGDVFVSYGQPDNVVRVTKLTFEKSWVHYYGDKGWGRNSEYDFLRTFRFVRHRRIVRDDPLLWAALGLIPLYIGVAVLFGGIEVTDGDPEKGTKVTILWYGTWFWSLTFVAFILVGFWLMLLRTGLKPREITITTAVIIAITGATAIIDTVIRWLF